MAANVCEYVVPTVPPGRDGVVIVSDVLPIVNDSAFDVDPPGFTTVQVTVPAEAIRLAGIVQVVWVALTKVHARATPLHCTVDPLTNPVPFTVSTYGGPPAVTEAGLRRDMLGVGALMVNVAAGEVAPPELTTVTLAVPAEAIRLAGTIAVNCVPLT